MLDATVDMADSVATAPLLGELDGDLEFFHELFDDFPGVDSLSEGVAVCSERRRQRWLAFDSVHPLEIHCNSWKHVATTQKRARTAAEDENARLRRLVQDHERAVTKMVKLLQRAVARLPVEITASPIMATASGVAYANPPLDVSEITRSLDALALGAESLLPSSVSATPQLRICDIQNQIVTAASGPVLESTVAMVWLLPFDVDTITSALVTHTLCLVTRKQVPNYATLHEGIDFKIIQAATNPKVRKGMSIIKQGQLAARREPLRSDGSQLVVMQKKGSYNVNGSNVVSIDGDSCILVSPLPGHDSAALGPLSQIKWFRRYRVQPITGTYTTAVERGQWINSLSAKSNRKIEHRIDKITQGIENFLLSSK